MGDSERGEFSWAIQTPHDPIVVKVPVPDTRNDRLKRPRFTGRFAHPRSRAHDRCNREAELRDAGVVSDPADSAHLTWPAGALGGAHRAPSGAGSGCRLTRGYDCPS